MNIFVYVFLTCWKWYFLTLSHVIGILNGVLVGLFMHKLTRTQGVLLFVGPIISIFIVMIIMMIKYPERRNDIDRHSRAFFCHYFIYMQFADSIITNDRGGIITFAVFLSLFYIGIPCIGVVILRKNISYTPNRELDVSGDYSRVHDTPLTTPALPSESINCSICLEPLTENIVKLNNCSHSFHLSCITEWLIRKRECPLCREMTETTRIPSAETETAQLLPTETPASEQV